MNLSTYLSQKGRGAATRLAADIGAHLPDVSDWANGKRPIPVKAAVAIEEATGQAVTRKEMFPCDWQDIWPELANTSQEAA